MQRSDTFNGGYRIDFLRTMVTSGALPSRAYVLPGC